MKKQKFYNVEVVATLEYEGLQIFDVHLPADDHMQAVSFALPQVEIMAGDAGHKITKYVSVSSSNA